MNPAEQIKDAIHEALAAAAAANNAACSLTNLVLIHRPSLISDATIVRETATLLQHVAQNFNRTASVVQQPETSKGKKTRA